MALNLTEEEINKRLVRLRNLEYLHAAQLKRNEKLLKENRNLRERVSALEARDREKDSIISELKLQIEELRRMVFGRKHKKQQPDEDGDTPAKPQPKTSRTSDSYHRPVPKEEEVTGTERHGIDACTDCNTPLEKLGTHTFYEEDIVLPDTATNPLKTSIKHEVERGWCRTCRGWRSAIKLPPATVVLGKNVKLYICYLSILIRLSFEQIRHLLETTYHFSVSNGEIAYILAKEAQALKPEYEALKERIRVQRGVHYDETGHPVQREEQGAYAWVMAGTETDEVVFDCGRSRGKGVAEELKGDADHVGITDDYGAYRTLFTEHQLCFAHPHRKLRDLVDTDTLTEAEQLHCRAVFEVWSALYADLRSVLATPFDKDTWATHRSVLMERFDSVASVHPADPAKLARIKAALRRGREAYFTCLLHEGIPADNNKAERALRHLVLKRRISFGSRTQKGAETFSILASVLLSLWRTRRTNFFQELLVLRGL